MIKQLQEWYWSIKHQPHIVGYLMFLRDSKQILTKEGYKQMIDNLKEITDETT